MSGEQLPAVNTWFKLREIILRICTMATLHKLMLRYILEDYFRASQTADGRAGGSVGQEELLLC